MSESSTASLEKPWATTAARIGWAVLILATLYVCYFSHLGAIGFVGPDEPRYAWIARDMAETGDWVTPRLYGKPWFEKPPLYYWGAAISFKVFGVSEAAARLPSAISALLATLALAWLALRMYGAETARWLLLLLPTTVGMIGFSHAAATDMPFSGMLTIAMVCAAVVLRLVPVGAAGVSPASKDSSTPWIALVLFGFFLGLAVLAKGPAGIILCGGAVFFWAIFTKRWHDAFRLLHPAAIGAFCVTALPWYILCARRNPDFFRIFIIEHNFKRFLTPEFQHTQPFWFYGAVLVIALLPWTALAGWSSVVGAAQFWRLKRLSPSSIYFLMWVLFCVVFFSISKSKLPGYILPAIPALAVLMTHTRFALATGRTRALSVSLLVTSLLFAVCSALVEYVNPHISQANPHFGIAAGYIFGALSAANLLLGVGVSFAAKRAFGRGLAACCVLPILFVMSNADRLLPSFFYYDPSGRTLSKELQRRAIPIAELAVVKPMSRGQRYSLSFYLHQEIAERDRARPEDGYVVTGRRYSKSELGSEFTVEEIPFGLQKTGLFLYRIQKRSPIGHASSGELQ
ncbi:MAG: glycosyltransferase family 39 protein [Candidatus Acidiferrales bacterium]